MDVALYIVPEKKTDNIDTSFKANALATLSDELLVEIAISMEVDPLMSFLGKNPDSDLGDFLNILDTGDEDSSIYSPDKWFSTADGLNTIGALKKYAVDNSAGLPESKQIVSELEQFETILNALSTAGLRWHLAME
ncbi:MAG: hypothetical protein OEV64_11175 [Desulfobulbaceae bacterium]|nr:hypothetical protein [Desulfobulbaceae bacterium]